MTEFKCNYDRPWQGPCPVVVDDPLARCKDHDKVCVSCGADATHDCSMASSMVCGAPLCDNCTHSTARDALYTQLSAPGNRDKFEEWKRMPTHVPKIKAQKQSKLF